MANKFHKAQFFLTQANRSAMYDSQLRPAQAMSALSTARVLQETVQRVSQDTADNKLPRSCNISSCSTTEHYIHSPVLGLWKASDESLVQYKLLLP